MLGREFLLDWVVIMRPLAEPQLPLTNNEAERALRHYCALLASVIETCRLRAASVIDAARRGLPAPPLPAIPG